MHLARLETRIALESVFDKLPNLRLDPDAAADDPHIHGMTFRSPTSLPVLFDPSNSEEVAPMGDAVILSAVRTPIGDAKKGALARTPIHEIAKVSVAEAMKRANVPPSDVDDIVLGEVMHGGGCIARYVALDLGLPPDTPGMAVQRHCATGLQAVVSAAADIKSGHDPRRHRRRRREHVADAEVLHGVAGAVRRHRAVDVALTPDHRRRADDHGHHRRGEHRRGGRA